MKLSPDIIDAIVKEAGDRLYQQAAQRLEDLRLVPLRNAAKILGVCAPQARKLLKNADVVELGENTRRYKISTIRKIIQERTI